MGPQKVVPLAGLAVFFLGLLMLDLTIPHLGQKTFRVTSEGVELLRGTRRIGMLRFDSDKFRLNAYDFRRRPPEAGTQEAFVWRRELDTMAVAAPSVLDALVTEAESNGIRVTRKAFIEHWRGVSWETTQLSFQRLPGGRSSGHA